MSNASKYRKKAVEYEQLKQFDRAIASYARAIEENENAKEDVDVALFNKVGDLTLRQGRVTEAVTYYERAVEHYVSNNLFDNAIALCNKILRNAPGRSNVYFTLGRICARKGLRSDATRNFLEYATRMQQDGRVDEGMRALAEVADLMPELTEVHRLVEEHAARAGISLARKRETPVRSAVQPEADPVRSFGLSKDLVFLEIDYDATKPLRGKTPPPQRSVMSEATNAVVSSIAASEAAKATMQSAASVTGAPVPTTGSLANTQSSASASAPAAPPTSRLEDLMIFDPRNSDPAPAAEVVDTTVVDGASILRPYVDPETPVVSLDDFEPTVLDESTEEPQASAVSTFDEQVVSLDDVQPGISAALFSDRSAFADAEATTEGLLPTDLSTPDVALVVDEAPEIALVVAEGADSVSIEDASDIVLANDVVANDMVSNDVVSVDALSNDVLSNEVQLNDVTSNDTLSNDVLSNDVLSNDVASNETSNEAQSNAPQFANDLRSSDDRALASSLVENFEVDAPTIEAAVVEVATVDANEIDSTLSNEVAQSDVVTVDVASIDAPVEIAPTGVSAIDEVQGEVADTVAAVEEVAPQLVEPMAELTPDSHEPESDAIVSVDAIGTVEQEFDVPVAAEHVDGFTADDELPTVADIAMSAPISELVAHDVDASIERAQVGEVEAEADVLPSLDFDAMLAMTQPRLEAIPDLDVQDFAAPVLPVEPIEFEIVDDVVVDNVNNSVEDQVDAEDYTRPILNTASFDVIEVDDRAILNTASFDVIAEDSRADDVAAADLRADDLRAILNTASFDVIAEEPHAEASFDDDSFAIGELIDSFESADELPPLMFVDSAIEAESPVAFDVIDEIATTQSDANAFELSDELASNDIVLDNVVFEDVVLDDVVLEDVAFESVVSDSFESIALSEPETDAATNRELVFLDVSVDEHAPVAGMPNAYTPFDSAAVADVHSTDNFGDIVESVGVDGIVANEHVSENVVDDDLADDDLADDDLGDLFGDTGVHVAVAAAEATIVASSRCAELQSASDADPNNYVLRRRLAEALFEAGNRDAAISELGAALAIAELANLLNDASEIADELVRVDGDDVAHHQKRLELAIRLGDQTRLRDAYLDLADTLVRRGEDLRAKAVYARVLEIDPHDDRARTALGDAAPPAPAKPAASGSDEGHVNLADWLREDDEPVSTRLRMREPDVTGDEQDDFNSLLRHFKEGVARSLGEDDYESHYDLGVAYKEMGLLDDAIGEFQMALRSRNNRLAAYEALGQCFLEQQNYKVAVTVLSRALHEPGIQDEQRVGVLYLLGYSCEELQRFDEARSYFQRVYATDIHFRDVAQRLADLERTVR